MIEAIGGNVSFDAQSSQNTAIGQEEFIRLFLTQLSNQDPLEPVDNSQFLAQMAQFTNLEQTRELNENVTNLLAMNSSDQGISLIGRTVDVNVTSGAFQGSVTGVQFGTQGITLTVRNPGDGSEQTASLNQVTIVQ